MKSHKKITASKLLTRFDNELKALLLNDLKSVKHQFLNSNHQVSLQVR